MRMLIVDDDGPNRKLLEAMVTTLGDCDTAESGQEALSAFQKAWEDWRPFNLIFLDILMPEMDGNEVLLKIREIEKEKKISQPHQVKIIMVTGVSEEDMVMACLKNGCDDFLVKPIERDLLFEKIKKVGWMQAN